MYDIQPVTDMSPTYKDTVSVIKMFLDPICDLLALPVAYPLYFHKFLWEKTPMATYIIHSSALSGPKMC